MERELNRKEKEKDGQVRSLLENMTPRVTYAQPLRMKILITHRKKSESTESLDQLKREQLLQRIIYQRESEIPKSPLEAHTQKIYSTLKDIHLIPFFKAGSYPPKIIRIIDQPAVYHENYMKIFTSMQIPPPPPPVYQMYNPPSQIMLHHQIPSSYVHSQHQPPPPRVGPLPSGPIQQYNPVIQSSPAYDPALLANPMDPYSLMNKSRTIYNPVTKKPQNYKTAPCRGFHSQEGCERGNDCHFIHNLQFQGRPMPSFPDWKNNHARNRMQSYSNYPSNGPSYFPPPEFQNDKTS
ncbi:hypothetical protein SteCoe_18256 [Stentor coeruleus]|uniref:C3H1-type domain-containing protein n=1 Tax=Stentor coeruleus TaxID=5963 RepID=A0A1R2BX07_9CILI|nr:hypothetical protein SteCoe_18256 [Stentor coeruleus]